MRFKYLAARLLTILLAVWILAAPALAIPQSGQEQLDLLEEIAQILNEYALYPAANLSLRMITPLKLELDPELFTKTVESWLADDPYGYFMSAEEYDTAFGGGGTSPGSSGIGIEIDISVPTGIYVLDFLPGGSAEESGIEIGAQIVSADGVDITDMPYLEGRTYVVGNQYSTVTVGYVNPGTTEVLYEDLVRHNLSVSNVDYSMINDTDIGYISVAGFDTLSDYLDFADAYNLLLPAEGAESLIIDLRGNPGGVVDVVYYMLDAMIEEAGVPFFELVGNGESEGTSAAFNSLGWTEEELAGMLLVNGIWDPEKIVILVDERSASAAELMAGALQVHDLAEIVGTATYGKAHAQFHLTLSSGDILILTFARNELPVIGTFEGTGIIPDYEVEQVIIPGSELGYEELYSNVAIFPGTKMKNRVTGLQERLRLLGYYRTEPTGVFDDYTVWALNRFQEWQGLRQTPFASVPALRALDEWLELVRVVDDKQLDYAIDLCS